MSNCYAHYNLIKKGGPLNSPMNPPFLPSNLIHHLLINQLTSNNDSEHLCQSCAMSYTFTIVPSYVIGRLCQADVTCFHYCPKLRYRKVVSGR